MPDLKKKKNCTAINCDYDYIKSDLDGRKFWVVCWWGIDYIGEQKSIWFDYDTFVDIKKCKLDSLLIENFQRCLLKQSEYHTHKHTNTHRFLGLSQLG